MKTLLAFSAISQFTRLVFLAPSDSLTPLEEFREKNFVFWSVPIHEYFKVRQIFFRKERNGVL